MACARRHRQSLATSFIRTGWGVAVFLWLLCSLPLDASAEGANDPVPMKALGEEAFAELGKRAQQAIDARDLPQALSLLRQILALKPDDPAVAADLSKLALLHFKTLAIPRVLGLWRRIKGQKA